MKFAFVIAVLVVFSSLSGWAQSPDGGWMRVASDDGQFSVEVPTDYKFVSYKDGFSLSHMGYGGSYELSESKYLTTYVDGTLLAFESYKGPKGVAGEMLEQDGKGKTDPKTTTIKKSKVQIRQLSWNTGTASVIRQYFGFKDRVYVLTAASRKGITSDMNRFFDSLLVGDETGRDPAAKKVLFSQLKTSEVAVDVKLSDPPPIPAKPGSVPVIPQENGEKLDILLKSNPGYTDAARKEMVSGTIRVRVTFGADGWVPRIIILKQLPDGLLRQALFSVLRMKFLPKEVGSKPQTVDRVIEYSFEVY